MTHLFPIYLLIICSSFSKPPATYCNCSENLEEAQEVSIKREYYYANLIFTGKVVSIKPMETGYRRASNSPVKYTFEIEELIKGYPKKSQVEIYSTWTETSCGYMFEQDVSYLVFSKRTSKFRDYTREVYSQTTQMCIGNTLRRYTLKKRLDLMRKLAQKE